MAWNPDPEVAVAREAARKLGRVMDRDVDRVVIMFTTCDGKCGYVSYGTTAKLCREARNIAELAHAAAFTEVER